jgi:SulP family sulfate permease
MAKLFQPKLFSLIRSGIGKEQLTNDIFAGIVVGIVALPLSIAFAVASGVSPERGLITAIVAGFLISLLGGSRVQIGGPTGAFVILIFGIVNQYGINGLIISTMMAGILLMLFGFFKLGTLLKYFPHPLIVGFTSGIALVIFSTQIRDALGLPIEQVPTGFLEKWKVYLDHIDQINPAALAITAGTILITALSKRLIPRIPGSIIAIILATLLVKLFHLPVPSIETFFGTIPKTVQLRLPEIHFQELGQYFSPALAIALLGGIESLLSAVVSDGMIGGKHRSNTELIAQGIANLLTPIFGGLPATGALARTATNVRNGGRTPLAGITHSITLLLIMLLFGQWAKWIPMSCLAGILIVVAYNMSEWRSFRSILKGNYFDILILLTTFFLTVLYDLTIAIEIGVVLSALLFMKRMADISDKRILNILDTDVIEDYKTIPDGISIFEISGPLFFASARRYSEVIEEIGLKSRILIIRMRHVSFIDETGLKNLRDAIKILRAKQITIILSGVAPEVRKNINKLNDAGLNDDHICDSFKGALEKANAELRMKS